MKIGYKESVIAHKQAEPCRTIVSNKFFVCVSLQTAPDDETSQGMVHMAHLADGLESLQHGVAGDQEVVLNAQLREARLESLRALLALVQPCPLPLPEALLSPPASPSLTGQPRRRLPE